MKKILLTASLTTLLVGCSSNANASMINPWKDCNSLQSAEDIAGFNIELPTFENEDSIAYRVLDDDENPMIEVIYSSDTEITIRKQTSTDSDISGDYNEYSIEEAIDVDDKTVTIKSNTENKVAVATWDDGEYSYSFSSNPELDMNEAKEMIQSIQ